MFEFFNTIPKSIVTELEFIKPFRNSSNNFKIVGKDQEGLRIEEVCVHMDNGDNLMAYRTISSRSTDNPDGSKDYDLKQLENFRFTKDETGACICIQSIITFAGDTIMTHNMLNGDLKEVVIPVPEEVQAKSQEAELATNEEDDIENAANNSEEAANDESASTDQSSNVTPMPQKQTSSNSNKKRTTSNSSKKTNTNNNGAA